MQRNRNIRKVIQEPKALEHNSNVYRRADKRTFVRKTHARPAQVATAKTIELVNAAQPEPSTVYYSRVEKIFEGETIYIIGGGPSLVNFDFRQLVGCKTIAINKAILFHRADVCYWTDGRFYTWFKNEVDNYNQTHYQLHYTKNLNQKTNYNIAAHYTHGEGYYEQEKLDQNLSDYNLSNIFIGNDTIFTTDLIRRKWLNNDFGGLTYSLNHKMNNIDLIVGGAYNKYSGQHYGNVIWSEFASNGTFEHEYYRNIATKYDNNIFVKANYAASQKTSLFIDMQLRNIDYEFNGNDIDGNIGKQNVELEFFNPKLGLTHKINKNQIFYGSYAVANKEPNRADYVESSPNSRPVHETLYDTEVGYKYSDKWMVQHSNHFCQF